MNKTTFTQDLANKQLIVHRSFNASIKLVWKAFTDSSMLDQWWAPKPWRAETKSMDFREGGFWLYCMCGPEGEAHWGRTDYHKIVPLDYYEGVDVFCDESGNPNYDMPQSAIKATFIAKGGETEVRMVTQFPTVEQMEELIKMGVEQGLAMAFENLDGVLAAV